MKSLFKNKGPFLLSDILNKTLFSRKKKIKKKIYNISNLQDARKGDLTFFDNINYIFDLKKTKASYCLIKEKYISNLNRKTKPIISTNPLIDFILIANMFYPESKHDNFSFKQNIKYKKLNKINTFIDSTVRIGANFKIGINSVLKKNVIIGKNVNIGSGCIISNTIIGDNVTINDGAIIGKIGYGFKFIKNNFQFIPHMGCVIIEDNVYIGSNCTIDRGSYSNTIISKNVMIDNLVHIAHNVKIGSNTLVAGQVGIAGSSVIGSNCMIGGQAGVSGHLKIGNNVKIAGNSGVLSDISDNESVMGYPAENIKNFLRKNKFNDK